MKRISKMLLVFALVAVMMGTAFVSAKAATYTPQDPVDPGDPVNPGHTHVRVFKGFEWNINTSKRIYKAFGMFECEQCGDVLSIQADVTATGHECTATVTYHNRTYTETIPLHQWVFKGFEWNTDNGYKAFGNYECSNCGEKQRIEAVVTKTARGYKATISAANAPDGIVRTATIRTTIAPVIGPAVPRKEILPGLIVPALPMPMLP